MAFATANVKLTVRRSAKCGGNPTASATTLLGAPAHAGFVVMLTWEPLQGVDSSDMSS